MSIKPTLFITGLYIGLMHYEVWSEANAVIDAKIKAQQVENIRALMQSEKTLDQAAAIIVQICAREGRSDCTVRVAQ